MAYLSFLLMTASDHAQLDRHRYDVTWREVAFDDAKKLGGTFLVRSVHGPGEWLWIDSTGNKSSAVAEMGDRGHNRHGPKRGGGAAVPLSRGELGPHVTQCGLGRDILPYQVASSSIQPFDHNRHGSKTGGCAPFRGELEPHLTQRRLGLGRGLPPYQVAPW